MIDIRQFRKDVKEGRIQVMILGNVLYLHDVDNGTDHRIGPAKIRHPEFAKKINGEEPHPICPVCGEAINDKERANYCSYCGTKFDWMEGNRNV